MNQEEIKHQHQLLQAAVQAYQGKDLDGSESLVKQILSVNAKEPNALHLLGCIYKDRGQLQEAVDLIQASIQEDDSNPIPLLNLGKILLAAGQHKNAAVVFQASLKINHQIPETWFCFGNALKEINQIEEAKQAYRIVLQLNFAHAGAAVNLGLLLIDDDELDEAKEVLIRALGSNSEDLNCLVCLGNVLTKSGDYNEAIASYHKAIELNPDYLVAYDKLFALLNFHTNSDYIITLCGKCWRKSLDPYRLAMSLFNLQDPNHAEILICCLSNMEVNDADFYACIDLISDGLYLDICRDKLIEKGYC